MVFNSILDVKSVVLTGQTVRLEPLSAVHVPALTVAGSDERIWRFMLYGNIQTEEQMAAWVQEILSRQTQGGDLPFAVIHLASGQAIGSTRYMDIRHRDRALEIGGTWYATQYQRTVVNTESKYLLLEHAFEKLGCVRVQFKTDSRNERSQRALERIGAVKEGVLRRHLITPEGYIRDSVFYSIIDSEWPDIKQRLVEILTGHAIG
jgi:RimJ/RimL family protein N-acetyltransferase